MLKKLLAVVGVVALVVMAVVVYSFLKTPEAATRPIETVPITGRVVDATPTLAREATAEAAATTPQANVVVNPPPEASADAATQASPQAAEGTGAEATISAATPTQVASEASPSGGDQAASPVIFEIVPAESTAKFSIDEILRGQPKTVVGATNQVAGQLAINPNDLSAAQVGVLQVNARALTTDSDMRNRAIKNRILLTDQHEYVTFTPKQIVGLSGPGSVGETYTFQVVGDLTITDVTRQVTFDVTATAISDRRIEGSAKTAFPYTDFQLFIPNAPGVQIVDGEVSLELEFVAEAVS
jgi:polyisoprenoid-binding protein YceI